jgi:hypothetical protein
MCQMETQQPVKWTAGTHHMLRLTWAVAARFEFAWLMLMQPTAGVVVSSE